MKIKGFFLNHVEKLVLLAFIVWCAIHVVLTFKPTEIGNKAIEITNLATQVEQRVKDSAPPVLKMDDFYGRMSAPFLRVPGLGIDESWKFYWVPSVSSTRVVREGGEEKLRLSLVKQIDRIEVPKGSEYVQVEQLDEAGLLKVKGLKEGEAEIVVIGRNKTKETTVVMVEKEKKEAELVIYAPNGLKAVPERGRVRLIVTPNPDNDSAKAFPPKGHRIFRKELGGEWAEVMFIKHNDKEQSSKDSDAGKTGPGTGAAGEAGGGASAGGAAVLQGAKAGEKATAGAKTEGKEEKKEESDAIEGVDYKVKPDMKYYYAAAAVGKMKRGTVVYEDEEKESDRILSEEVHTKPDIEIFLEGVAGDSATATVQKWLSDTDSVTERFFMRVGDEIGETKAVKVGEERRPIDFGTDALLVDIRREVREAKERKRQDYLRKDGELVKDPKSGQFIKIDVTVQQLVRTPQIVVLDARGRIREYIRKDLVP